MMDGGCESASQFRQMMELGRGCRHSRHCRVDGVGGGRRGIDPVNLQPL